MAIISVEGFDKAMRSQNHKRRLFSGGLVVLPYNAEHRLQLQVLGMKFQLIDCRRTFSDIACWMLREGEIFLGIIDMFSFERHLAIPSLSYWGHERTFVSSCNMIRSVALWDIQLSSLVICIFYIFAFVARWRAGWLTASYGSHIHNHVSFTSWLFDAFINMPYVIYLYTVCQCPSAEERK